MSDFDISRKDTADRHASDVVVPIDVGNEHAEVAFFDGGGRDAFYDGLEKIHHVFARAIDFAVSEAHLCRCVKEGGVELIFVSFEIEEEFEHLVVHPVWARRIAVDFVDHTDRLQALIECLAEHPTSLSLWAANGIGQQKHAIDHFHHTFHLGAEVGVTWGVHDVNSVFFLVLRVDPLHGEILRLNGDALFTLKVHRVHGAFFNFLILAVSATLCEQAVHESGLAVVNVGNDSDVTDVFGVHEFRRS